MMQLIYPIVSRANPFLQVFAKNLNEADISTTGETKLFLSRVGAVSNEDTSVDAQDGEFATYLPLEIKNGMLTFVMDSLLFDMDRGRYSARLVYKGTELGRMQLIHDKPGVVLIGSNDV